MKLTPPAGAADVPVQARDAFDVPVLVRWSTPLRPGRRPRRGRIDAAHRPWPAPAQIAPNGMYRVPTTWRDVIDAALSVGRDPTAWLAAVPALASSEIIARRSPLAAYLGRRRIPSGGSTGFSIEPNVVYRDGTERTAQAAFAYRIGMTMAEWACRGLMGLGPTTHAEAVTPASAGPAWSPALGLPDLIGDHAIAPSTWLVEAKGARRLMRRTLVKGAAQLCVPDLVHGPHMRVLCGASLEHRLFVTIDVEKIEGEDRDSAIHDVDDPGSSDQTLMAIARSRMLFYLALISLSGAERRIVPVGHGVRDRAGRRAGATVMLLEDDDTTTTERSAARRDEARYLRRPGLERLDMLIGRVPGTDLIIGMSRRLFAACRSLAEIQTRIVADVDREYPSVGRDELEAVSDEQMQVRNEQRRSLYWQQERALSSNIAGALRAGFTSGERQSWEALLGERTPLRRITPPAIVEAATSDTYLALDVQSVARWTS
ncbi:hypothetical protein [Micromonospora sp. WMMD1082]|uniref:hypothetical protein n=1 Tax=Micromonospora sp. WMMD1082 TaxID=3016104 RepID=UPI002416037F|nr:hypothetical protein [Micromonospora sp. WMMD1082]MDG4793609.1 hypothetical protein [Micromonospora sp. WMMD1082]